MGRKDKKLQPRFTLRLAFLVIGLYAVSFALIRLPFFWYGSGGGIVRFSSLTAGVHLLVGTTGASIGALVHGRKGTAVGAMVAILIMWFWVFCSSVWFAWTFD